METEQSNFASDQRPPVPGQPAPTTNALDNLTSDPGTLPMALGIASLVAVFVWLVPGLALGIAAIVVGRQTLATDPENQRARAGRIMGVVATVIAGVGLAFVALLLLTMAMGVFTLTF